MMTPSPTQAPPPAAASRHRLDQDLSLPVSTLASIAAAHLAAGNHRAAAPLYQKLTAVCPDDIGYWHRRLECARQQRQGVVVELILDDVLSRHPEWADTLEKPLHAATRTRRLSCEMIEFGLHLSRNKLMVCCTQHHGRGAPVIGEFRGGPFPFDLVQKKRQEMREANRTGVFGACEGCPFLKVDDWPDEPQAPIMVLFVGHSSRCQLRCDYCYTTLRPEQLVSSDYDIYTVCEDMIRKGWLGADATIFWAGGEPTAFRRFDETFRMLSDFGTVRHQIYTNAVRTSAPLVEALNARQVMAVCSLDAGTRETYAKVKGRDLFHRAVQTCANYAATGGDFSLKYICLNNNSGREDLDGFLEIAQRLRIRTILLDTDYAYNCAPARPVFDALVYLFQRAHLAGIEVGFEGASRSVPELDLVGRVRRTAQTGLLDALRGTTPTFRLDPTSADHGLVPLHQITLETSADGLLLNSLGTDPYFALPNFEIPSGHRALISIDITATQADLIEVYYLSTPGQNFTVENRVRYGLSEGRQQVVVPAVPLINEIHGALRLDPGCFPGQYRLHGLSVYIVPTKPFGDVVVNRLIEAHQEDPTSSAPERRLVTNEGEPRKAPAF
ncbi:MAG: radical SAM protein [Verrucomicrobiales bacterium]|nr:radical SAM protein [Verrucomicrobiales bacterium]